MQALGRRSIASNARTCPTSPAYWPLAAPEVTSAWSPRTATGPCSTSARSPSERLSRRGSSSARQAAPTQAQPAAALPGTLHQDAASGRVGVVIVDHGSRKKESNMQLLEFAQLFRSLTGAPVVECAHMEIAEPSIEQAIGECVAKGVDTIVIAPYFLSRGRHIQEDIPQLVREAQAKYNGIKCVIADPVGIDPLMAQLICNRVNTAVEANLS